MAASTAPLETTLSRQQAFRVLRDVAQTEITGLAASGAGFGDLGDVMQAPGWTDRGYVTRDLTIPVVTIDESSASVLNYTLQATRSADKKHFNASLTPIARGCGTAWFVDDRSFVIWEGTPPDCSGK
jgi:hypothetical protein